MGTEDSPRLTLPHDDVGTGSAVILLHAGVADRRMWSEHLQPLAAAGLRVVAVDLPGYGQAPAPTVEDAAWVDVLACMDALAIERAAVVGNSFGGAVALRMAVVAPERVTRLALISSPASDAPPSPELAAVWDAEEEALERDDIDAAVRVVVDAWTVADAPEGMRDRVAGMQRRAFEVQAQAPNVPATPDPLAEDLRALAGVDAPALVAVGEQDMPDFHAAADALAAALPDARRVLIEGAGHLAPLEQPEVFRELLLSFLV